MRATEIIRGVLDLIDQVECATQQPENQPEVVISSGEETIQTGVDTNRFKHIFAMLDAERGNPAMYDNSPNETIASPDSVTKDAGGGVNGPKNPADIKADSLSMYPNHLHRPGA